MSPLVRCLLRYLSILIAFFVFLLLYFKIFWVYFRYKSFIRHVFCKYFSQSMICLLSLLTVSFVNKFLILIKSNYIFLSWILLLVLHIKNLSPNPRSCRFSPKLYSRSLIALCFSFWSRIHFESFFCIMCKV